MISGKATIIDGFLHNSLQVDAPCWCIICLYNKVYSHMCFCKEVFSDARLKKFICHIMSYLWQRYRKVHKCKLLSNGLGQTIGIILLGFSNIIPAMYYICRLSMYHWNRKYHNTLKRTLGDDKITNQGHTNSDYHQWQNKLDALALVVTFKNLIHSYTVHQILYLCVVWKQNIKMENVQNLFCLLSNLLNVPPVYRSVNFLLNIKSLNYLVTVFFMY